MDTSAYIFELDNCAVIRLTWLFFRFFVIDRWQHTLVLDHAECWSHQGTDVLFREDQGGNSQQWHVLGDFAPDVIQLLVNRIELSRQLIFFSLCRSHKEQIDKYIGHELRIRNMATNTVFDCGGGTLHGWKAHGDKKFQMVSMRPHV
jgi:hypothetical protein